MAKVVPRKRPGKPGKRDRLDPRGSPRGCAEGSSTGRRARDGCRRVKRSTLLRHLRRQGCYLKREGASHSFGAIRPPARSKPCRVTRRSPIVSSRRFAGLCRFRSRSRVQLSRSRRRGETALPLSAGVTRLSAAEVGPPSPSPCRSKTRTARGAAFRVAQRAAYDLHRAGAGGRSSGLRSDPSSSRDRAKASMMRFAPRMARQRLDG
jgi:hypothetical protein